MKAKLSNQSSKDEDGVALVSFMVTKPTLVFKTKLLKIPIYLYFIVIFAIIGTLYLVFSHASPAYSIISSSSSGQCLNVDNNSNTAGASIIQWPCSSTAGNDLWELVPTSTSGYYEISSSSSGQCLNVSGNSTTQGASIIQWPCSSTTGNDLWKLVPTSTSGYYEISSSSSGQCINVDNNSNTAGASIIQWPCSSTTGNDLWSGSSLSLTLSTPAPQVTLTANPSSVNSGQASTLTWSTTNATSCTASGGWSGTKATSGSVATTALTQTTTYGISCTAANQTPATATTTVSVIVPSPVSSEIGTPTTVDGTTCSNSTPVASVTGYTSAICQDFNNGLGDFGAYSGGGSGTVVGDGRVPSQCTVSGGYLHMVQSSDGATCGGSMNGFDQRYGLWEVRMRAYSTGTGSGSEPHPVFILWPANNAWTSELDWFETDIGSPAGGYLHCTNSNGDASQNCYILPTNSINYSQWHVYSILWTPTSMSGYIDGKLWWTNTNTSSFQPLGSSILDIQLDNLSGSTPVNSGEMDINWVHMFAP